MTKAKKTATEPEEINPRFVRRGDIIEMEGIEGNEVVRDVTIVIHMANGMDYQVKPDKKVKRLPPEDFSEYGDSSDDEPT